MKIGRLIALGLVSLGALELYENRKTIKDSYQNTKNETDSAKLKLERIKNDLAIISQEKEKIRLISQELNHKFQVFNKDIQPRLEEINQRMAKYQEKDE